MQRLGGPWRRLCAAPHSIRHDQVRFAGTREWRRRRRLSPGDPLRQTYPTFEFPEVVLDLDAESSPYARSVSEKDWQREVEKYEVNSAVEYGSQRIAELRQENSKAHELMKNTTKNRFNPWQVSDMDVLSVALDGAPRRQSSSDAASPEFNRVRRDILSRVLHRNGITERITSQDDTKVIHFMNHRQALALDSNPWPAGYGKDEDVQSLDAALQHYPNFRQMQRLVLRFAQTPFGCWLITKCGERISDLCHKAQEDGTATSEEILIFLNNLTINLQSRKVDISKALCVGGLRAASAAVQPTAAAHYISLIRDPGSVLSAEDIQGALGSFLAALSRDHIEKYGLGARADIRSEILTLLTGRSLTSYVPQTSLRATIGNTAQFGSAYSSYIVLLGELGALRMLWHEWKQWPGIEGGLTPQSKVPLFADALIQCATSLQHRGAAFDQEGYNTITGDIEQDAALDLKCIRSQDTRAFEGTTATPPPSEFLDRDALLEQFRGQVKPTFLKSVNNSSMSRITELVSAALAGRQRNQ